MSAISSFKSILNILQNESNVTRASFVFEIDSGGSIRQDCVWKNREELNISQKLFSSEWLNKFVFLQKRFNILASDILKQRQKVIRIADESEMEWKVVDEYVQSEIASDEEDRKRIYRAQSRAARKAKTERGRRGRRPFPYRTRVTQPTATVTQPTQ